jgi:hypothetical protein
MLPGMTVGARLALLAVLVAGAPVRAEHDGIPGAIIVPGGVVNPSYCWPEVKLFDSLRSGPVDFCRKHLAYRPGRLECAQVEENVCWVLLGTQWAQTRTPVTHRVLACPEGPQPPVCPRMTFR